MIILKLIVLLVFLNHKVYSIDKSVDVTETLAAVPAVEAAVQSTIVSATNQTNSTSLLSDTINKIHSIENVNSTISVLDVTVTPSEGINITTSSTTVSAIIATLNVTEQTLPSTTCPAECKCAPSLVDAICTGRGLHDIPYGFSSGVKMLILTSNNITEIGENSFKERHLFELMSLLMNHNRIATLHPNAFVVLKHLEVLDLGDNSLMVLSPDLFINNMALATLRLDNNTKLQIPSSGALINAPTLHDLNISSCNISFLPNDIFSGTPALDTIDLSGNKLKELNPSVLKSLPDLVIIILPKSFEPKSHEICLAHEKLEKIVIRNNGNEENIECGKLMSNLSQIIIPPLINMDNFHINETINETESKNIIKVIGNVTSGIVEADKKIQFGVNSSLNSESTQNISDIQNDHVVSLINNNNTGSISNIEVHISPDDDELNRIVLQSSENKMKSTTSQGLSGSQIDNIIIGILLTVITVTGAAIIINLNKKKIDGYFKKRQRQSSSAKTNEFEIEPLKNVVANQ